MDKVIVTCETRLLSMSLRVSLEILPCSGKAHFTSEWYRSMHGLLNESKGESELNTRIHICLLPEYRVSMIIDL